MTLGHHPQPLLCFGAFAGGYQHAIGLPVSTAHPAPQLVELRKAEPVGILHDHQGRPGHIDAHLDHGGAHQHLDLSLDEILHHLLLFPAFQFAVHQADGYLGDPLLQCLGIGHRRLPLVLPLFGFDERTDDVHLSPFLHLFLDKGIQPGAIAGGNGIGFHLLASRGQFVQHRYL